MMSTLGQRRQLLKLAFNDMQGRGKRFKPGAMKEALVASIWARDEGEVIDTICRSMDKNEIPEGIELPWGNVIKP